MNKGAPASRFNLKRAGFYGGGLEFLTEAHANGTGLSGRELDDSADWSEPMGMGINSEVTWPSGIAATAAAAALMVFIHRQGDSEPAQAAPATVRDDGFGEDLARFNALKDRFSSLEFTTVEDVESVLGKPIHCNPRPSDSSLSVCSWLLHDTRLVITSTVMGPLANGSPSPETWVGFVIFTKDKSRVAEFPGSGTQLGAAMSEHQ